MENPQPPLPAAMLYILVALSEGDLHGYGIMQSVKRQTEGQYKLGPGTLYANLAKLLERGLVKEMQQEQKSGDLRREYSLSYAGRAMLRSEIERLEHVVKAANRRLRKLEAER